MKIEVFVSSIRYEFHDCCYKFTFKFKLKNLKLNSIRLLRMRNKSNNGKHKFIEKFYKKE